MITALTRLRPLALEMEASMGSTDILLQNKSSSNDNQEAKFSTLRLITRREPPKLG